MYNPFHVKIRIDCAGNGPLFKLVYCLSGAIYIYRDQSGWIKISHAVLQLILSCFDLFICTTKTNVFN